jgi:ABC-type uncharacterized transport system involved in gliding motility auxiliary subunit
MSARRFAVLAALALFISFIASNVIANSWFRSWRLDLTENHLYTLSPGTQHTLDALSEPIELKLYYSRDAATVVPQLQVYAARVREMLQSFAARSRGRVRFVEVNVEAYSLAEDEAVAAGVEPYRPYEGADPIYFGLVGANAIDERRTVPIFDPQREAFLEYELTRLIYELENPDRARVALITSLPIDPNAGANPFGGPPPSVFATELGRMLDITTLAPDFTEIPDVDVLAIIHPGELSAAQLYAIDQFILRRGRAFIALDPASLAAEQGAANFNPFSPTPPAAVSSDLETLLAAWGVALTPSVILDGQNALPVLASNPMTGQQVEAPQPLFFLVPPENLDREDLMTAWLQRGVNFGLSGALTVSDREGVTSVVLAHTSSETMRLSIEEAMARPSPFDLMQMWSSTGGRVENIAVRLSGALPTAFPDGPPAPDPVEAEPDGEGAAPPLETPIEAPAPAAPVAPLTRSETQAEIVIVADTDFLADDFYIDPRSGAPAADNASFALNAIDVLSGSDALISLRSRGESLRAMDLVDDMERQAQRRIQERQEALQAELAQTEARLQELQARGAGSGFFAGDLGAELTPEETAEIESFRARLLEVREELRGTERTLRSDINQLEAMVLFINVWMAPLLVAAAGLFLFWRRQRRGSARS